MLSLIDLGKKIPVSIYLRKINFHPCQTNYFSNVSGLLKSENKIFVQEKLFKPNIFQDINIYMDPAFFGYYAFPTKKARLVFIFEKPFLEN